MTICDENEDLEVAAAASMAEPDQSHLCCTLCVGLPGPATTTVVSLCSWNDERGAGKCEGCESPQCELVIHLCSLLE